MNLCPAAFTAGIDQHEVRQTLRITQRILEGNHAAKGMPKHSPLFKTQLLAKLICIRGEIFPGHGCDFCSLGTAIAAVIVEDQGELVCRRF